MNNKWLIGIVVLCIVGALAYGGKYLNDLNRYKNIIKAIKIKNVDLSRVNDGTYTGAFDAIYVGAKVKVEVIDHKIKNITLLEHKQERGKAGEGILQKVLAKQTLEVDAISSATNSSKVILKSIENALNQE